MKRHSSGKKEIKNTKRLFSGSRTSKPAIFLLGFLLIVVGIFGVLYNPSNSIKETLPWEISETGTLSFSQREEPVFTVQEIEDLYSPEDPDILKLVSFESSGEKVQALLRIPANSPSPGIVLLPGAGVSKEGEQGLATELSKMGYATLTLDQRNQGAANVESDLELFRAGLEPVEYLMVYDALKATDILSIQPEIDPKRLAIIGESNGGRFAIIACALDPSLKGVIGISTSGYGTEEIDPASMSNPEAYWFYRSIDPDTYLSSLSPSRLVLIHSFNDTVISHELALRTFDLAKEPKAMYNATEETHGYTASMRLYLEKELALLLK
ncbi:alpha/beta hydrolase [Methanosarcina sp.]|uniref:alpha/beta hydrolase n=1 Tax=Methanosarcina sp. TaxID=2213 RepID=UPI002ABC3917|nr:alpha/beta hydrolase [Methanosarcina sp.]MDY9927336.1 alpha/beta hydrolase [Methanosarcina sp.]